MTARLEGNKLLDAEPFASQVARVYHIDWLVALEEHMTVELM